MSASPSPLADLPVNTNTTSPAFSSAPSTAPGSVEPAVQPMHQGNLGNLEMQRQLLQQKLAERENGSFTSPTDDMMTPCSKKLQDHKKKAYTKTKPISLSSRFNNAQQPGKENKKGGIFGTISTRSSSNLANPFNPSEN